MLVPRKNNPEQDKVYTPEELATKIVAKLLPANATYLDPCSGLGSFVNAARNHTTHITSLELDQGTDFAEFTGHVDWIITNPPWSKFREFMIKAMQVSNNIAYLAPINHFITKARLRDIETHGFYINEFILVDTPKNFPQSGFQLVVGVLSKTKTDTKWSKL